jgi:hypothetical protein
MAAHAFISRLEEGRSGPWALFWLVVLCVVLAALTLPVNAAPAYDPWSWIVWGRDVVQGDLHTETGPSWKPLPVLLTAPMSLFGDAAPDLWLVAARAAAFGAAAAAALLGLRLGGPMGAVLAGGLLLISSWLWQGALLGDSEAILILCVLAAVERHLAGRRGQAFAFGVAAGLLRPEAWAFLGLYALWLVVSDRSRLAWVASALAVIPTLWLLPELWGSGNLWRGAERAQRGDPDAPAFAARPAFKVVENFVELLPAVAFLGVAAGGAAVVLRRVPRDRLTPTLGLAVLGGAWVGLVAVMAELGFSGINRYLATPLAIAHVLAGVGLAWTFSVLLGGQRRAAAGVALSAAVAVLALGALARARPEWPLPLVERHGDVNHDLDVAIERAGGEQRLKDCGRLYASSLVTPPIAWRFDRHLDEVTRWPAPPGVLFRTQLLLGRVDGPPPRNPISVAPGARILARTQHWEVRAVCQD